MAIPNGFIKSKAQVKEDFPDAEVYTTFEFSNYVKNDYINNNDGVGYFHNGYEATKINVYDLSLTFDDVKDLPYVLWYPK